MAMGIPARIFATLLKIAPGRTRNWMWKWWYQRLAKAHGRADFRFMNYGYKDGKIIDEASASATSATTMSSKNIMSSSMENIGVFGSGGIGIIAYC